MPKYIALVEMAFTFCAEVHQRQPPYPNWPEAEGEEALGEFWRSFGAAKFEEFASRELEARVLGVIPFNPKFVGSDKRPLLNDIVGDYDHDSILQVFGVSKA